jgi:hypothetical protein
MGKDQLFGRETINFLPLQGGDEVGDGVVLYLIEKERFISKSLPFMKGDREVESTCWPSGSSPAST